MGLRSGQPDLVSRLRTLPRPRELLLLGLEKSGGDQERAARILGVPLSSLLKESSGGPEAPAKKDKPVGISFQAQALVLIHNHREWTVQQYADALDCGRSTLYNDPIIKRALQTR